MEDVFYHLNKQVLLALDFCGQKNQYEPEEKKKVSYEICKEFFRRIPRIRE